MLVGAQWVRMQFTRQLTLSRFLTASSYSSSEGISWGHQETPFTRNICRVRRLNQYYTPDRLTDFLQMVKRRCQFDCWFLGHYHQNRVVDNRFIIQWEQMVELQ